jgi:hypothetical protein
MNEQHKEICEDIFQKATTILKNQGHIEPTFFVLKDNTITVLLLPSQLDLIQDFSEKQKHAFRIALQTYLDMGGDALIHLSEAWTVTCSVEELNTFKRHPSEHPSRIETVNLLYMNEENNLLTGNIIQLVDSPQKTINQPEWKNLDYLPFCDAQPEKYLLH